MNNKFSFNITLLFFLFLATVGYSQKVLTLDDALKIALKESYQIKSATLTLQNSQYTLDAIQRGLRTSVAMEFDLPRFSRNLKSQFNPETGAEQFYEVGNTTLEGRLFFNQPLPFSNGTFSLVGTIFGRDQFAASTGTTRDYFTNLAFRLRQPLFSFNSLKASLTRAEINLEKARRNYSRTEMDIIYNVSASFYDVYKSKKELEIATEKVQQTQVSYETAMNKFKAGLIAEVEALQLELDLAASKNQQLAAETNYLEAKNNFKILIGLPMEDTVDVSAQLEYSPVRVELNEAIEFALKNRYEIQNSEADIMLSSLTVEETDSKGNISGMLVANYGINKNDDVFKDVFNNFAEDRSVTFTLSIPLIDWGQNRNEVQAAEASLQLARLNAENQKALIIKEIQAVYNKLKAAEARVEVLSKSVDLAQKSYDISLSRFRAGNITSFDLSQMQIRLTDAKINSLGALIDYRLALADLERKTLHKYSLKE